jgi:hypothetical protein
VVITEHGHGRRLPHDHRRLGDDSDSHLGVVGVVGRRSSVVGAAHTASDRALPASSVVTGSPAPP